MSGRQSKNCKPIKINRKIYLKLNDQPPLRYHLVSMVNHHGRALDSGHYTTLGLTPYGYYYFNDTKVCNITNYVLITFIYFKIIHYVYRFIKQILKNIQKVVPIHT